MATLHVSLEQQEDPTHFIGRNDKGVTVHTDDGSAYPDGVGQGVSPMQLLIMSIGSCSGLDVVYVMEKQRQQVDAFRVEVTGEKPDGVSPSPFESIHVEFHLDGPVDPVKAGRAAELSIGKYCSVARMLERAARISYEVVLNGEGQGRMELPAWAD